MSIDIKNDPMSDTTRSTRDFLNEIVSAATREKFVRDIKNEQDSVEWSRGISTNHIEVGYVYVDPDTKDKYRIVGIDSSGKRWSVTANHDKHLDSQSQTAELSSTVQDTQEQSCIAEAQGASLLAMDAGTPLPERIPALEEWGYHDNDSAASFVLEELKSESVKEPDWLAALIYAAEDLRFDSTDQQNEIADILQNIALKMKDHAPAQLEQVINSAIRRFASLVEEDKADQLIPFLKNTDGLDTRLVALQSVGRIFEVAPLQEDSVTLALRNRLFDMAKKLLLSDVLVAGETSAMAQQAVYGLASMGDKRLHDCVVQIEALNLPWFKQIIQNDLNRLRELWKQSGIDVQESPACKQLESAINALA